MQDIVDAVQSVASIMGEISSASLEQSSGIDQVNRALSQMDQATQRNAALVEHAAKAARRLEAQALPEPSHGARAAIPRADPGIEAGAWRSF